MCFAIRQSLGCGDQLWPTFSRQQPTSRDERDRQEADSDGAICSPVLFRPFGRHLERVSFLFAPRKRCDFTKMLADVEIQHQVEDFICVIFASSVGHNYQLVPTSPTAKLPSCNALI